MQDTIVGIAVLYMDPDRDCEYLIIRCACADGSIKTCEIPVYPSGTPKPKDREHCWSYAEHGQSIDCSPSVNWVGVFHNQGRWQVRFERFGPDSGFINPGDLYTHLNGPRFVDALDGRARWPQNANPPGTSDGAIKPFRHGMDRHVVHQPQ